MNGSNEVCQICGGIGYVTRDVPVGDPDFGKAFLCICQADKARERRAAQLRTLSNLDVLADKTFATFEIEHDLLRGETDDSQDLRQVCADSRGKRGLTQTQGEALNTAVERVWHYAQEPVGWLVLQGNYGTGKTHLAAAVANYRLTQGQAVLFITTPDLLDHLRATFGPSSEVAYDERFEQFRSAPLLVLDDLGAESPSTWAQEKLYQLISYRHARRLSTIITTNIALESLEPRIRSRVLDHSIAHIVTLSIPDRRSPAMTWQEIDLSDLNRYKTMTFDTFDLRQRHEFTTEQRRHFERGVQAAQYFAESPRGWLVLVGPPGTGKTHLAAAIAWVCRQRGERTLFVTATDLLDHLRITFYPGSTVSFDKRLFEIRQTDVLILDSLNIDKSLSSWARDKLFDILLYRFDYNLSTVITTNQPLDEIDLRLKSRITNESHSQVLPFSIPSYPGKSPRRAAAPRQRPR